MACRSVPRAARPPRTILEPRCENVSGARACRPGAHAQIFGKQACSCDDDRGVTIAPPRMSHTNHPHDTARARHHGNNSPRRSPDRRDDSRTHRPRPSGCRRMPMRRSRKVARGAGRPPLPRAPVPKAGVSRPKAHAKSKPASARPSSETWTMRGDCSKRRARKPPRTPQSCRPRSPRTMDAVTAAAPETAGRRPTRKIAGLTTAAVHAAGRSR